MAARWLAFVIWAAVAASASAWALRLLVPSRSAPLHTSTVDMAVSLRGDLTRLFGVDAAPPPAAAPVVADNRFKLVGVAAARTASGAREGLALIAVDGKPARAFRVGATVDGDTVLQEVRARGASLGPRGGASAIALEIAPLAGPATGTPRVLMPGAPPAPLQPGALPPGVGGLPAGMPNAGQQDPGAQPQT